MKDYCVLGIKKDDFENVYSVNQQLVFKTGENWDIIRTETCRQKSDRLLSTLFFGYAVFLIKSLLLSVYRSTLEAFILCMFTGFFPRIGLSRSLFCISWGFLRSSVLIISMLLITKLTNKHLFLKLRHHHLLNRAKGGAWEPPRR